MPSSKCLKGFLLNNVQIWDKIHLILPSLNLLQSYHIRFFLNYFLRVSFKMEFISDLNMSNVSAFYINTTRERKWTILSATQTNFTLHQFPQRILEDSAKRSFVQSKENRAPQWLHKWIQRILKVNRRNTFLYNLGSSSVFCTDPKIFLSW